MQTIFPQRHLLISIINNLNLAVMLLMPRPKTATISLHNVDMDPPIPKLIQDSIPLEGPKGTKRRGTKRGQT